MKACCEHCPFKRDTLLVLHPSRADEFAAMAENPFNDFPCHKTADYVEDDEFDGGGFVHGANSFTCHGFKGMQEASCGDTPEFKSDGQHFEDWFEMTGYHEEAFNQRQGG
jgi:hypothetical protein